MLFLVKIRIPIYNRFMQNNPKLDTLHKFIFLNITVFLFCTIFLIGFFFMQFMEYVFQLDPLLVLGFYVLLAVFDQWITKKIMCLQIVIKWINDR